MRCAPWGHSSCGKTAAAQPQMPPAVPFALLSRHVSHNGRLCSQPCKMPVIPWVPTRVLSVPASLLIPNPFISCLLEDRLITIVCNDSSCTSPTSTTVPFCSHPSHSPVSFPALSHCHYKQINNSQTNFSFVFNRDGEIPV